MERKTIGAFIAVLRKAKGMTQRELAEKLNVSDKTVSRWERDEGSPDLAMIPVLSEIFSVSCDELLRGERRAQEQAGHSGELNSDRGEKQRRYLLSTALTRFKNRSYIAIALAFAGLIGALIANFGFVRGRLGFFIALLFYIAAILCQIIFRNNAMMSAGELDEPGLGAFRLSVLHMTEFSLGLNLVLFSSTLPLLGLEYTNAGLLSADWMAKGAALAAGTLALACIACWLLNGRLRERPEYAVEEKTERIYRKNHRLKGILGLVFAAMLLVTGFAHLTLTQIWGPGTIMEGIEFDDLNSFAEFMEKEEGMPLHDYDYNAKFYDEQGNEISSQEASRKYLTDGNGNVVLEYVQNNRTVCSVQAKFQGEKMLELRVFTYDELEKAKAVARQRHMIFACVYCLELAAVTAVYFRKREK